MVAWLCYILYGIPVRDPSFLFFLYEPLTPARIALKLSDETGKIFDWNDIYVKHDFFSDVIRIFNIFVSWPLGI